MYVISQTHLCSTAAKPHSSGGVPCLRDSDMQEHALGTLIASDFSTLRRGDLLFWKGHVAIVRDPATLIHANAFHMAVVSEPMSQAIGRLRADGNEPTSVRRLERPTQLG